MTTKKKTPAKKKAPAVDLPRLVRQFDFQTGCPPETGWYLVELDQPGLINDKPFDVDMCRIREDSEGRKKADWAYWYDHNIRRWAILPNLLLTSTSAEYP